MGGVDASGSAAASAAGPLEVGVAVLSPLDPTLSTLGFQRAPTCSLGNIWPPWLGADHLPASAPSLTLETQPLPESFQTLSGPVPHGDGSRHSAPALASSKPHVLPLCPVTIGHALPCWGHSDHLTPVHLESTAAVQGHPGQAWPGAADEASTLPPRDWRSEMGDREHRTHLIPWHEVETATKA